MGRPFNQTENDIRDTLVTAAKQLVGKGNSNAEWSNAIKSGLCALGDQKNLTSWASGFGSERFGEWMFDLVWLQSDTQGWGARIDHLHLIMESEWLKSDEEAMYDFQKLLAGKAAHKLMICEVSSGGTGARIDLFRDAIKSFKPAFSGERYMMAIWDDSKAEFHFDLEVIV